MVRYSRSGQSDGKDARSALVEAVQLDIRASGTFSNAGILVSQLFF
jgi:hypothetical protein